MRLKRLIARHADAISRARRAGLTWDEIGARLGVSGETIRKAYARTRPAMFSGRLVPEDRLPLPDFPSNPVQNAPRADSQGGDKLRALIEAGPDPTRGLQHLVLSRFKDIAKARSHLRRWDEIADALDLHGKGKALSSAFSKVRRGLIKE